MTDQIDQRLLDVFGSQETYNKFVKVVSSLSKDPDFINLSEEQKKSLESVWTTFVTIRATNELPNWGMVVMLLNMALPKNQADIFSRSLKNMTD